MTLKRWNWEKHEYEDYVMPDSWNVSLFEEDLSTHVNCASCGKDITIGLSYTSMEIHSFMGLGYAVCRECYVKEMKRRFGNG